MSITIYTYNDSVLKDIATGKWLKEAGLPPIPANTIRVRTNDGNPPVKDSEATYQTATLVTGTTDVYDVYKSGSNWAKCLYKSTNITEVLGSGDLSSVIYMSSMFNGCTSLTTVALFDTSNVTGMMQAFFRCTNLKQIPLFNTSKVNNMNYTFQNCINVESGALALYNQMINQTTPPSNHNNTFYWCGKDTTSGAAELAQIPSSWGGTAT